MATSEKAIAMALMEILQRHGYLRNCVSCDHWDVIGERCLFDKLRRRPPASVIVEGCPSWKEADEIPF